MWRLTTCLYSIAIELNSIYRRHVTVSSSSWSAVCKTTRTSESVAICRTWWITGYPWHVRFVKLSGPGITVKVMECLIWCSGLGESLHLENTHHSQSWPSVGMCTFCVILRRLLIVIIQQYISRHTFSHCHIHFDTNHSRFLLIHWINNELMA